MRINIRQGMQAVVLLLVFMGTVNAVTDTITASGSTLIIDDSLYVAGSVNASGDVNGSGVVCDGAGNCLDSVSGSTAADVVTNITALQDNVTELWSNATDQDALIFTANTELTNLWSNASGQSTHISSLYSNDTDQDALIFANTGSITSLWSNATDQDALIFSNAEGITDLWTNATEQDGVLTFLWVNASGQTNRFTAIDTHVTNLWSNATDQDVLIFANTGGVTDLWTNATGQETHLTTLRSNDTQQESQLTALRVNSTSQSSEIFSLNSNSSNQDDRIILLEAVKDVSTMANITDWPDCDAADFLRSDAGDPACATPTDTTYTAGNGLTLASTVFSAGTSTMANITDLPTCGAGDFSTVDGSAFTCATPTDTTYTAGNGLTLVGTVFDVGSIDKVNITDVGALSFDWIDSEVADDITLASGANKDGSVTDGWLEVCDGGTGCAANLADGDLAVEGSINMTADGSIVWTGTEGLYRNASAVWLFFP